MILTNNTSFNVTQLNIQLQLLTSSLLISAAVQPTLHCRYITAAHRQSPRVNHQVGVSLSILNTVQDLDEIPKAEAVRAVKHCEWAVDPGKDDCVALEGSFSYYSYSWYMGEPPAMLAGSISSHPILVTW